MALRNRKKDNVTHKNVQKWSVHISLTQDFSDARPPSLSFMHLFQNHVPFDPFLDIN